MNRQSTEARELSEAAGALDHVASALREVHALSEHDAAFDASMFGQIAACERGASLLRRQVLTPQPPSEEVVEAVARAIYDKDPTLMFYERGPGSPPGNQYLDWERAPEGCRKRSIEQARAAIAAMPSIPQESDAEVTEAMERAATAIQLWWMTQKHEPMHRNDALDLARTAMTSARDKRG